MTDTPTVPRGAMGPEGYPVSYWVAPAEVGFIPTTLLDPYRRADIEYELYHLVTPLVAGVLLGGGLDYFFTVEETKRPLMGAVLLLLTAVLCFLCWRLRHFRSQRDEAWKAIEEAKTYPTAETGPPTDLWRYDFIDYFNEAQKRHPPLPGSEIEVYPEATCDQQSMRGILEHPPVDPSKSTTLIYDLMVPPGTSPLKLEGFIGILTERASPRGTIISQRNPNNSVLFGILINGKSRYRKQKYTSKWEEFSISVSRSESLNICFTTNCFDNNEWNWAAWGEPRLVEQ